MDKEGSPNPHDKISSEEDAEQLKSSLKPDGSALADHAVPSSSDRNRDLDSLLNKTEQKIKDHDAKKDANEVDIKKSVITTREQRIKRVRARVNKNVQGYQAKDIDANYKIVLIGDAGVGKTSLLLRFADDIFNQNPLSTIGVDFKIKTLKVDNKIVKM